MFKIDPKKTGSLNDGGRSLKIGTFPYTVTGASMVLNKSNPTGKEQQVVIDLCQGADYNCKVYLGVMAPSDVQREIAEKTLVAFFEAAGIGGTIKPSRLKLLSNKIVVIEAKSAPGKGENEGKTFVNIKTIEAYDPDAAEQAETADDSDDDDDDSNDDSDTDSDDDDDSDDDADADADDDDDSDDDDSDDDDDDDDAIAAKAVAAAKAKKAAKLAAAGKTEKPAAKAEKTAKPAAKTEAPAKGKRPW